MIKLKELMYSLASVIIRYHDRYNSTKYVAETNPIFISEKTRRMAIMLFNKQSNQYIDVLQKLIRDCPDTEFTRKPLLFFLLHEIIFLYKKFNTKTPFNPDELQIYKEQVTRLLNDLRQLLCTPKDHIYIVYYSQHQSEGRLNGLLNNGWTSTSLCFSGELILEDVFKQFHILTSDTDEEIKAIAEELCDEHNDELLAKQALVLQEKVCQLESTNALLMRDLSLLKHECPSTKITQVRTESDAGSLDNIDKRTVAPNFFHPPKPKTRVFRDIPASIDPQMNGN